MSDEQNAILAYADSYRKEAGRGQKLVDIWSLITDIERNMAPHLTDALSQLAALREELVQTRESHESMRADLVATEQRLADLTSALERGKMWMGLFRAWIGNYGVVAEDHLMVIRTLKGLPQPPSEFDATLNKPEEAKSPTEREEDDRWLQMKDDAERADYFDEEAKS